jgi:hypothetical protein
MPKARKKTLARVVSSQTVFRGPVFSVVSQQVQEPDGVQVRRDIVEPALL